MELLIIVALECRKLAHYRLHGWSGRACSVPRMLNAFHSIYPERWGHVVKCAGVRHGRQYQIMLGGTWQLNGKEALVRSWSDLVGIQVVVLSSSCFVATLHDRAARTF